MLNAGPRRYASRGVLAVGVLAFLASTGCANFRAGKIASAPAGKLLGELAAPLSPSDSQAAVQRIESARNQAQCEQAIQLWQAEQPAAARRLLEQVLTRDLKHAAARRLLADLALEQGDPEVAEKLLLQLRVDYPDDQAAAASLAWLYESQGRTSEAQALFEVLGL